METETANGTPFSIIYDSFFARVTSDMYMEMTEADTMAAAQDILLNAIPRFEFPRFDIWVYTTGSLVEKTDEEGETVLEWEGGFFDAKLTHDEVNVLSLSMVVEWLGQQLATTENTSIKYSGTDFKFTSQANHMAKIKNLKEQYEKECFKAQRLYKRRIRTEEGEIRSTIGSLMEVPTYGYKVL